MPLDAQFRLLKGVLERMYGDRVSVRYRQHSRLESRELRRLAAPLPAVVVDNEIVLRGHLHLQVIANRLNEIGVTPKAPDDKKKEKKEGA